MWILETLESRLGIEFCRTSVWLFAAGAAAYFLSRCLRMVRGLQRRSVMRKRRVEYCLPDRENSYVRARLQTALRTPEECAEEKEEYAVCLSYARALLAKLKSARLTQAERLETENLEGLLSLYFHKTEWSIKDLRTVNDACTRLLKLSAKYAV